MIIAINKVTISSSIEIIVVAIEVVVAFINIITVIYTLCNENGVAPSPSHMILASVRL